MSVTITGQLTHFDSRLYKQEDDSESRDGDDPSSSVYFGSGINVITVKVTSATSLVAQINVSPRAALGPRTVTVTTGRERASLQNGFTVVPVPLIKSVSPNTGFQGQQLSVVITGQDSHFSSGQANSDDEDDDGDPNLSQVNFGAGITVLSTTVTSATVLTAQILIAPDAPSGPRTVSVRSGRELAFLDNGFTVLISRVLTKVSPNSGQQGQQGLSVALTGLNTHFVQGASQVSFGSSVTVRSVNVTSPTTAIAVLDIDPAAAVGLRNVSVTTNSEIVSLPNGFTITPGTPVLTTVNPNTGQQGQQRMSVVVTGRFTHFSQATTAAGFGAGITVTSLTVISTTSATAVLNIDPSAAVGARNVMLTTGTEVVTLANGFTITNGTPSLLTVNPNTGQQGQKTLSVALTGQFTHWIQGTTTASFGTGITVASITVNSATSATAVLNIDQAAAAGARNVTLTTGTEVVTLANGFAVTNGTPLLTTVNPNTGQQGQQNLSVTLTGQSTHWVQGTTTTSFGAGITVVSLTVGSATTAMAVLNIDPAATVGPRNVTLTTGTEAVTLANGFAVTNSTPVLTTVNPNAGQQGQQNLSVTLTGQFTHWLQGTMTVTFGAGITVASVTVNSATTATAVLNIDPAAAIGVRNVTLTTGTEVVTLANSFAVTNGTPLLTTVNPNTGLQGQQSVSVAINGQFTHWVQRTTTASFGAGITVASLTVSSATTATAALNIDPAAATGGRNVAFTTGTELVTLNNGFTVNAAGPLLTTVNPNTGQQGQ